MIYQLNILKFGGMGIDKIVRFHSVLNLRIPKYISQIKFIHTKKLFRNYPYEEILVEQAS